MDDSDVKAIVGLIVGAGTLVIALYAAVLLVPLAALVFAGWLVHYYFNKSPKALERKAREHTHALYEEALKRHPHPSAEEFAVSLLERIPELPPSIGYVIGQVALDLYTCEHYEGIPEPPLLCNSLEGARYRDMLSRITAQDTTRALDITAKSMNIFVSYLPEIEDGTLEVQPDPNPEALLQTILPFYDDQNHFPELKAILDRNLQEVSGVPERVTDSSKLIMPPDYEGENIQYAYLKDTPLLRLFDLRLPFTLPESSRWEHTHIVGGTGQGKTTLLKHLILEDLKSDRSVVVVDSQGELIPQIARLKLGRNVIILDPRDNPTLNVFDIGQANEQTYNQTLEVFSYLFNSLLGADLTTKQTTLFNYMIALMLKLPEAMGRNATLLDIMNFMDDPAPYGQAIDALDPIPRKFFQVDFNQGTTYKQTKEQIRYRLQAILGNKTLARLFLAPKNTVSFFEELNNGSVILIDTSKAFLAETQSSYMGKIAIALVWNAIAMRTGHCHSTMVYVDEAHEYFSDKIDTFLNQARKKKTGITLAQQNLAQTGNAQLRASFASSTSIKFAGGVSDQDARALARDMRTTPDFILSQPKLHFACYVKNTGTAPVHVPVGIFDDEEQMTDEEYAAFRERNRARVSSPLSAEMPATEGAEVEERSTGADDPTTGLDAWE